MSTTANNKTTRKEIENNFVRHNSHFKEFFEQLLARGKKYKVALVAVMRKLLSVLNIMLKTKTMWKEKSPAI